MGRKKEENKDLVQIVREQIAEDTGDNAGSALLFARAAVAYLTDRQLRPAAHFYPIMRGTVGLRTFQRMAQNDQWETKRQQIRAKAQRDLVERVSRSMVHEQVKEAEELLAIRSWLFEYVTPERGDDGKLKFPVAPRSLGEVIKSYRDILILLGVYRSGVLQQVERQVPDIIDVDTAQTGPFSPEEAGEMARTILRKRIAEREAARTSKDPEEG